MKNAHVSGRTATTGTPRISVTYHRIEELKPNSANPRHHTKKQVQQIASSIEAFGFNVPILVDAELRVIAGHGRLLACRRLGWSEVPTISLAHLSETQASAFLIADNRLTEISNWDDELLAQQLNELSRLELDFNIEATGFEMDEINLRIEALGAVSQKHDPADAVPELSLGPAISKPGDLWLLGNHRVLCASARDPAAYEVLMAEERAAMAFSDPCNVRINGDAGRLGAIRLPPVEPSGEIDEATDATGLIAACCKVAQFSREGALHFICTDWRHLEAVLAAGQEANAELKDLCVWVKDNAGMGSFYRDQHELVLVFQQAAGSQRHNVRLGRSRRHRSNVWRYPGGHSCGRHDAGKLLTHRAVKPVAMVVDAILDGSSRGEIVLDAFLGSGTTVIAAERTGRRSFGLELNPAHVDAVIRRWQALSRGSAYDATSGRSFDDLAHLVEVGHAV